MYLFGASGHAKVVVDIFKSNNIKIKGFFDDDQSKQKVDGVDIIGAIEEHTEVYNPCIISIGDNRIRKRVVERLQKALYHRVIHSRAIVAEPEFVGVGTVVMAGAVINPATTVGKHCIINTSASVDHDCQIEDFVHIAPNATLCGGITVGEGSLIGSGATVVPNISIGKWATIGAGTVVISDIPDYATVVGNPGRVLKINKSD